MDTRYTLQVTDNRQVTRLDHSKVRHNLDLRNLSMEGAVNAYHAWLDRSLADTVSPEASGEKVLLDGKGRIRLFRWVLTDANGRSYTVFIVREGDSG